VLLGGITFGQRTEIGITRVMIGGWFFQLSLRTCKAWEKMYACTARTRLDRIDQIHDEDRRIVRAGVELALDVVMALASSSGCRTRIVT